MIPANSPSKGESFWLGSGSLNRALTLSCLRRLLCLDTALSTHNEAACPFQLCLPPALAAQELDIWHNAAGARAKDVQLACLHSLWVAIPQVVVVIVAAMDTDSLWGCYARRQVIRSVTGAVDVLHFCCSDKTAGQSALPGGCHLFGVLH